MAITKVTEGVRTLGTGEVTAANLAADATSGVTANQDDIALLGFKVAANGSLARYNLVDQSIDAFEDASGVDASASTAEVRNASNYYYGEGTVTPTISGNYDDSGVDGDYSWYKWTTVTSSGSYTNDTAQDHEYLVIAGGGGGGGSSNNWTNGGGGGGGGYRTDTGFPVAATTISGITVGAGGTGGGPGDPAAAIGTNGGNSVFSTITSAGGGVGGSMPSSGGQTAAAGGSGGGGGNGDRPGGAGNTPSTSPVQGYAGGSGAPHVGSVSSGGAGGGGGAGGVGESMSSTNNGGDGGIGLSSSIDGAATSRGGGAGGSGFGGGGTGVAGGASGIQAAGGSDGAAGTANTGGGGSGATTGNGTGDQTGGAGGSGIVIIRRSTTTAGEGADMTLVSNAQTAESAPTNGDLVMTISNGAGTTTPNTDIKAYITRDGSDYTTAVTLVDQGDTGGHTILTANGVDLSGETSGTAMRWKITTHNQSASKTTRIQAVSLGWS